MIKFLSDVSNGEVPLITFGIVNCNRLYYLKSCLESLLTCTEDYPNKEIIVIDNASIEPETDEYLKYLEHRGFRIFKNEKRDPNNEYAKALNHIVEKANGKYICLLTGDMQFMVRGGWLKRYVSLFEQNEDTIGSIGFDAQRCVTNESHHYSSVVDVAGFPFVMDFSRPPVATSGNCMFSKKNLQKMGPWVIDNMSHEGGEDSETKMWKRVVDLKTSGMINWNQAMPIFPVSIAIYTDARGTSARVRGNRRYGDYWEAKKDNLYYEIVDFHILNTQNMLARNTPIGIENVAIPIGWELSLDETGSLEKESRLIQTRLRPVIM